MMQNADINLGSPCNNHCLFCSNGDPKARGGGWMALAEVELELADYANKGFLSLGLLGGEPSLYPELEQVLRLARKLGFQRIALCSNGAKLGDDAQLGRWLDAGLNRVALSVHSHQAALEARITQRKGALAQKLSAIRALVRARDSGRLKHGLSLNTVLHRKLLPHAEDFVSFYRDLGIQDFRFNTIRPEHKALGDRDWVPPLDELSSVLRVLAANNESRWSVHMTFADLPWCAWPWEILGSPALRERYAGEAWDLETEVTLFRPDQPSESERFAWRSQRVSRLKTKIARCQDCMLNSSCEGLWIRHLEIYGPSELEAGPSRVAAALSS